MSGPRPRHLVRRGAVYAARFRLPVDLAAKLSVHDIQRSLATTDWHVARRRCLIATSWFVALVERLRRMPTPSRSDLEEAARQFFAELVAKDNVRRDVDPEDPDYALGYNVVASGERIEHLQDQLRLNAFDGLVRRAAAQLASSTGAGAGELSDAEVLAAEQLAARAELESLRHFVHLLTTPWARYAFQDPLFELAGPEPLAARRPPAAPEPRSGPSHPVGAAVGEFLAWKRRQGLGQSHLDEMARSLKWLTEVLGGETDMDAVTKPDVRGFRDGLQRLRSGQGKVGLPFGQRQTHDRNKQIKSETAGRYWATVRAFFKWAADEGLTKLDPTSGLEIARRRDEFDRTPAPFTPDELKTIFRSPLFAGHRSSKFINTPGNLVGRGSLWWAGILSLYTGMRAAEINQLAPGDFAFDAQIPIIRVRLEDDTGARSKRAKTPSSIRDIPISEILLTLGLREFVGRRQRLRKSGRLLFDIRTGVGDRRSDGLTKGWKRVLEVAGVHAPGRSFHVFRHTFTAAVRAAGAREDIIGALLGHKPRTITGHYGGGKFPMSEMDQAVAAIDYSFDVVDAVGGKYDPQIHKG